MRFAGSARTLLVLTFAAWAQAVFLPSALSQTADATAPLPRQCRIVLLPLPEPIRDARLLDALAQMRGGKRKRDATPKPPRRKKDHFTALQKGEPKEKPPVVPLLTPPQLRTIARVLFRETLIERLQSALKVALVSDDATRDALKDAPNFDLTPIAAGRLAAKLKADAVLNIADETLALSVGESKVTVMRVRVQVFGPRPLPQSSADAVLPERDFSAASAAERPVTPFGKRPSRIGAQGTGRAARQAALRAAHTLRTGEILPMCLPNVRFALAPVPAPPAADQMLFAPEGRVVRTAAARDLPTELSGLFTPDLSPLSETAILPPYKMRNALTRQGLPITALWTREDEPQIERARNAARKTGADYVLMAAVSNLDVDVGLEAGAKTRTWLAEGRAEAVGVLLRVSDGSILWRDRAAVTRSGRADRAHPSTTLYQEQKVARDAAKFALLDLKRRFHRYVARFEN